MRRRLVAVALAVAAMIAIAFLVPLAGLVRELARSRALTGAERDAQLVARVVTIGGENGSAQSALDALGIVDSINGLPVSIILPDGTVTGSAIPPGEDLTAPQQGASGDRAVPGGAAVYVPVVSAAGTVVVRVFVPNSELSRNVAQSWMILGALGLVLIGIGVFAADRLGRSLVRPVEELSAAAKKLGEGDLDARVEPAGPEELVEVGRRFNELARRIADLLQEERETAADLSHRLRTPMTALKIDVESLDPGAEQDRLAEDVDALERSVDHIIGEARRAGRQGGARTTDVALAVAARVAFWDALAEDQGRATSFVRSREGPFIARIPSGELDAALDAVLGNVFAHTAEASPYRVSVDGRPGRVAIIIDDAGPGLPGDVVLERGASTAGSTGLGLDIARRTVEAAGGALRAETGPLGGARIVLELPSARPTAE